MKFPPMIWVFILLTAGIGFGATFVNSEWIQAGFHLLVILISIWQIDKALNPSLKITYGWSCLICNTFQVESDDENLIEKVKLKHLEHKH